LARIKGAGFHAYLWRRATRGDARRALSRPADDQSRPWLDGEDGLGAVISDGRLEGS